MTFDQSVGAETYDKASAAIEKKDPGCGGAVHNESFELTPCIILPSHGRQLSSRHCGRRGERLHRGRRPGHALLAPRITIVRRTELGVTVRFSHFGCPALRG